MSELSPYRELVAVQESDCDSAGRMRAAAMTYYLQEAAAAHAEALGVGIPLLKKLGALWVVTRMGFEVLRQPERGEKGKWAASAWPESRAATMGVVARRRRV